MPFSSPKRKISDTENKLRLLCCLDALGAATQEQLWPFVAQLELMEYIPFCMFVDELKKGGAIGVARHALEGMLYLTADGQEQLKLFLSRVPYTDRQRIRQAAPEYAARLSERRTARAAYELAPEGEYRAACAMYDGDVPTMFLRVSTRDNALAESAVKGFAQYASRMFVTLHTLPFEPLSAPGAMDERTALAFAAPGSPAVCAFGGREHAGVAQVCHEDACYTLLLLMPDEAYAWGWARMADGAGEQLAEKLTALLREGDPA